MSFFAPRGARAEFSPFSADWDGLSDFTAIAEQEAGPNTVVVTHELDFKRLEKKDSVIMVHPERALDVENLARFMRDGGRLVLLDDYGTGDAVLTHFGLERTAAPRAPAQMLRRNPQFAVAVPAGADAHASVVGVSRVVTNHPTGLRHPSLTPVLSIPEENGEETLLAVAGAVGQGRLLAVGDSSLFMNAMLHYAGNKAFARGVVRYAIDDDAWGKRGGKVYLVVGSFGQIGSYGPDANNGVGSQWRAFIDAVKAFEREGFPPWMAMTLAILIGCGVIFWVILRAGHLHRPLLPQYAKAILVAAQGGVAGHAAVLAAPTTTRLLALLELKGALEDELSLLAGLEKTVGHDVLLRCVAEKELLSAEGLVELRALLLRFAHAETALMSHASPRGMRAVRDAEVLVVAGVARKIIAEAQSRVRAAAVPSA